MTLAGIPARAMEGLTHALRQTNPAISAVDKLLASAAEFKNDPLGFAYWAFPWGEPGTILEKFDWPDTWQEDMFGEIGHKLQASGDDGCVIQIAVRSGHGIGKSAGVGMLVNWANSTLARTRGVVTAMTEPQLRTKTWAEMSKWHNLSLTQSLFDLYGRSVQAKGVDENGNPLSDAWRIDAVTWNASNPSAFAGLHNLGRRILVVYDEASEIDDEIWNVTRGALTDLGTQIIWIALGQPTQTSGQFYRCFSGSEWSHKTIDSRTSRFANKPLLESWIKEYGEDSDFVRVRIKGLPPRAGISNFIAVDAVKMARIREINRNMWISLPKRMALDPARFGDDYSVVTVRQGPKVIGQWKYSGLDGPDLASRVVTEIWPAHRDITGCAVDGIGIGASACDALKRVPGFPLLEVNVSLPADEDSEYSNLRAALWGRVRKWIDNAEIPDDQELEDHLTQIKYGFDGKSRIQLESKANMKSRGCPSPDCGDSLALTFYEEEIVRGPARRAVALPTRTRPAVVWTRRS